MIIDINSNKIKSDNSLLNLALINSSDKYLLSLILSKFTSIIILYYLTNIFKLFCKKYFTFLARLRRVELLTL